jgi:glutamyl-tRNA synthetase
MIELFDISKVNVSASTFNTEKLTWLNHQYIMNSDPELVAKHLQWHMRRLDNLAPSSPKIIGKCA